MKIWKNTLDRLELTTRIEGDNLVITGSNF